MDKVLNFLADNYILLMVIGVVLLIALIGFVVEGKKKKKDEGTIDNSQNVTAENNVNTLNTDTNVVNTENTVNTDVSLNTSETIAEPTLDFGTPNTNQTEVTQDNNVNNGLNAEPVTLEAQTEMPVNDVNAQVVPNIVESEPTALDFGTPTNTVTESITNEPVVNESVVNQPVVNEPVVNEPVVSEPVNNMYNNAQVVQENVVDFGNAGAVNTPSNASEPAVLGGEMPVNNQTVNATSTTQVVNNAPASETPQVATIEIPTIEPVNVDTNNDQTPLV